MAENFLTTEEVSKILKWGPTTIRRMAVLGKIPAIRIGGEWRIPESELIRWMNAQRPGKRDIDYVF